MRSVYVDITMLRVNALQMMRHAHFVFLLELILMPRAEMPAEMPRSRARCLMPLVVCFFSRAIEPCHSERFHHIFFFFLR